MSRNRIQTVLHESKVQEDNKEKYEWKLWRSELRLRCRINRRRNWKRNVFLYQTIISLYFQSEIIKISLEKVPLASFYIFSVISISSFKIIKKKYSWMLKIKIQSFISITGTKFECTVPKKKPTYRVYCDANNNDKFNSGEANQERKVKCKRGAIKRNPFTLQCWHSFK